MEEFGKHDGGLNVPYSQLEQLIASMSSKLYLAGFPPVDEADLEGDFMSHCLVTHPRESLFHYYPDREVRIDDGSGRIVNYSRESLKSGRVHLSSPRTFNDPFDCTLAIDSDKVLSIAIGRCAEIIGMEKLEGETAEELANQFAAKRCNPESCQVVNHDDRDARALSVENFRLAALLSMKRAGRPRMIGADVLAGARSVVDFELRTGTG